MTEKWIDIETQRSHDQKRYQVSKAVTRLLRHDRTVPRGIDGAVLFDDVLEECRKKEFDGASQCSLNDWISILAKGGGVKKRFLFCLNPNSSRHFLYLRAIQGHSRNNAIDPELQDKVLLPEGIAEYIYHSGNASEMKSIIRSGLPGRWGPQGVTRTGGGWPARVPNLRVCKHIFCWSGTRRGGRAN